MAQCHHFEEISKSLYISNGLMVPITMKLNMVTQIAPLKLNHTGS